jgi:sugar/nucleoside kinase (ribokinase family)
MPSVYGIGNPLLDIIMSATFEALKEIGAPLGSMNLVDSDAQRKVIEKCRVSSMRAGGSCANTIRGVGWLRIASDPFETPCYTGAVGEDEAAVIFEKLLVSEGVEPLLAKKSLPTGTSAIAVTPDSERTMFTNLSACRALEYSDIHPEAIEKSTMLHTTGYMWDTENQREATEASVKAARRRGALISFDIADPFVVERYRESLLQWIPGNVDLLFANEEELRRLTGEKGSRDAVVRGAERLAPRVVMKVGADGCYVAQDGEISQVAGEPTRVIDTTGAGDAFAGGFLFGLLKNLPLEAAARLANRLAAAIVGVEGCTYSEIDGEWVRRVLDG